MSPSSGETTWSGWTVALPPPCVRAVAAFGPSSATRRSGAAVEREHAALVAHEHRAGGRRLAQERGRLVGARRRGRGRNGGRDALERPDARGEAQQAAHLVVDRRLGHAAVADGLGERLAPEGVRPRHREVERGAARLVRRARRRPVRHHDAVEAPLALERLGEQRALRHRRAVDAVVGGHERPGRGEAPDVLERREVELAQRALVDLRVDGHPVGLGLVGDVVLDGRGDTARLHAAHVRRADPAAQERVLGEVLEVAAAERAAVEVHARREEDVDVLAAGLGGEQAAQALDEPLVPARRERRRRRQVRGGVALVPAHAADAGRPVGEDHRPQPDLAARRTCATGRRR